MVEGGGLVSRGLSGHCDLVAEDDHAAIYTYYGRDYNLPEALQERTSAPGSLTIMKRSLEEPEVHVKRARKSKRHVMVDKVILHRPDVTKHLRDGDIVVDELCALDRHESEELEVDLDIPRTLFLILVVIYEHYMRHGKLPRSEGFVL